MSKTQDALDLLLVERDRLNNRIEAAELAALQDPENWEDDATEISVAEKVGAQINLRFDGDEFDLICQAAQRKGMRVLPFIRDAVMNASAKPLFTSITVSGGAFPSPTYSWPAIQQTIS